MSDQTRASDTASMAATLLGMSFSDGVRELVDVLHEQAIGCNYVRHPERRWHAESAAGPDGLSAVYRKVWDDPEPVPPDLDGWKHTGDHEKVARAMRRGIPGYPVE